MTNPMSDAIEQALRGRRIDALVIGASAGGITALRAILPALSPRLDAPVVVVVHMPDVRDSMLAEVFQPYLRVPCRQAQDKQQLEAGIVYFAPPGYHLSIERERLFSLSQEEPVHFSRPAIDVLMESAADAYGARLAAILLTGASIDGAAGMAAVGAAGGLTIVQDPASAEMPTMPGAAIRMRTPDLVLALPELRTLLTMLENS